MRAPEVAGGSGRLADARALARNLRTPDSGLLGQGVRFAIAGGIVAVVYLATTTVLASVVGLPFQLALAIGFCVGLTVHFTLQRLFVWVHHEEFALPFHHQAGRYLAVAGAQYGITAASTYLLPSALGLPTEVVYLATALTLVVVNFLVFRHGVFHPKQTSEEPALNSIADGHDREAQRDLKGAGSAGGA